MTAPVRSAEIQVRRARAADLPHLVPLCEQLGYPSKPEDVARRLAGIESLPEHAVFVAEAAGGALAGFVSVFVMRTLESNPFAEIGALVVDETRRSRGVGEQLVEQAEKWARENGCALVRLRSNVIRDRAHKFYERMGFQHYKTQKAFRKSL
jgi:GNAT superfamily N-acetyltransferase